MRPDTRPKPKASLTFTSANRVYLSLGSNLGDSRDLIQRAFRKLSMAGIKIRRVSSLYRTEPVGLREQPWFINCVAEVSTALSPQALLRAAKAIERAMGRTPGGGDGPRLIDIDILLYENVSVRTLKLTIPHPRMNERRFVLVPLLEVAPDLADPVTNRPFSIALEETADTSKLSKLTKK